jgi:hypothetical protein
METERYKQRKEKLEIQDGGGNRKNGKYEQWNSITARRLIHQTEVYSFWYGMGCEGDTADQV